MEGGGWKERVIEEIAVHGLQSKHGGEHDTVPSHQGGNLEAQHYTDFGSIISCL